MCWSDASVPECVLVGVETVVLLRAGDGLEHGRVCDLQFLGEGLEVIVNPAGKQRGFERAHPRALEGGGPSGQGRSGGRDLAATDEGAVRRLDAEADRFLMDIESDVVEF